MLRFPTQLHERAAETVADFLADAPGIDTTLVVNSCARGRAVPQSDLDMAALVRESVTPEGVFELEKAWGEFATSNSVLSDFRRSGRFSKIHLDLFTGRFTAPCWDDGGGPDDFEIEIGNRVAYAVPIRSAGELFSRLQTRWLPFYREPLRLERLTMARSACEYDLDHVPFFVERGLHFQAFARLYKALREFLQGLFIAHRSYPIAYDKWLHEQVAERLRLPDLYRELPPILSVNLVEGDELCDRADRLRLHLDRWLQA